MKYLALSLLVGLTSATCPPFNECYHGGDSRYPESDPAKFPRCWFWEENRYGCYNPINDSCYINKRNMIDINACQGQDQQFSDKKPGLKDACEATVCFRGGIGEFKDTNRANFPKCLWLESDGSWGCYNLLNNSCADINGRNMFDLRQCENATGGTPAQAICPDLTKDVCYYNFDMSQVKSTDQPQYWVYKDNRWGCSDSLAELSNHGVIDLKYPPAECYRQNENPYICE